VKLNRKERLKINRKKPKVDNGSLYAGSPMYFYCKGCEAEIVVPESYIARPKFCDDCEADQPAEKE